jgi:ATP-binding cassette subfamily F protein uup
MNILTINNLTKKYTEKILFENISFTINKGDKIGLLGSNGCGKSTLLKVITGNTNANSGEVFIVKNKKIAYLSQDPEFNPNLTVLNQIFKADSPIMNVIRDYESTINFLEKNPTSKKYQDKLNILNAKMDRLNAWEMETQVKTVLTKLGITFFNSKMGKLSGGLRKRVFLASTLLSPCDLLVLDEPTNHMDNEIIDWLETYLKTKKVALLMVTHDRYFLDRIVNKIIEIDNGNLYTYLGNYSFFLKEKTKRESMEISINRKKQNLYKTELDWIRAGAKARSTKQKARIDRFDDLKKDISGNSTDNNFEISVAFTRLGKKVINIKNLCKSYNELVLIKNFNYILSNNNRIGIIGKNGVGKSTLLKIITDAVSPDSGIVDIGSTVNIGYFSQDSEGMDNNLHAIEYIKNVAEFITTNDGVQVSASQMMENFLFTSQLQWSYISKLSGGEKRRLLLLKTLMLSPNVLILDEPTNDLDIRTLNVLENYLDNFNGSVIIVSHDRYFLDRTCSTILNFQGNGIITTHVGNYSDYINYREKETENINLNERKKKKEIVNSQSNKKRIKLTYHEKKELLIIEDEITELEEKLSNLEKEIENQTSDFVKLSELVNIKEKIEDNLLYKMERLEYLNNLNTQIKNE